MIVPIPSIVLSFNPTLVVNTYAVDIQTAMSSFDYFKFAGIRFIVNTSLYWRRSSWFSPNTQPNQTKLYKSRTDLFPSRIFTPKSHADLQQKLPLVVCVHGGGFILNNPAADDPLARQLADTANCIVISIDYRKSPQAKFPAAFNDVLEQALAAIEDPDLPIDRSRVVLCGSSAGGNLVLGAAQDDGLKGKLRGIIALYPLTDFVPTGEEKMATRPDPSIPDFLGATQYGGIAPLYLGDSKDVDPNDVRLSPTNFAQRSDLPKNMLVVGCEHDLLCHEDEGLANKLAAAEGVDKVDTKGGWRAAGVQWYKAQGQTHAFDHFAAKDAEKEEVRLKVREETYGLLSDWLVNVFAGSSTEAS